MRALSHICLIFVLGAAGSCVVPDPPDHAQDFHSGPAVPHGVQIGTPSDIQDAVEEDTLEPEDLPEDTTELEVLYAYIEHAVLAAPVQGYNVGFGTSVATTDTNGMVLLVTEDSSGFVASGTKDGFLPHQFTAYSEFSGEGVVWQVIDTDQLLQLMTQVGTTNDGTKGHILVRLSTAKNETVSGATLSASGEHGPVFAISSGAALPTDTLPGGGSRSLVVPNVSPGAVSLSATSASGAACKVAPFGGANANLVISPATVHSLSFICPD